MKKLTVLFFIAISFLSVNSQTIKKVLFIGNSYTYVNNLPLMVSNMAASTGDSLKYDANTPGGYRLMNHAADATTISKIKSLNWDYVVLQAQSQETSWTQQQMNTEVFPYAKTLCQMIRENNNNSCPLFYMTWGRKNGDAENCDELPWVCTYEGMDSAIRATYIFMADTNNAKVSPVGAVWRYVRTNYPHINLYASDGSHPSPQGTYIAACAFYSIIYKKDPTLITWNYSFSDADANIFKNATKKVVFDSLTNWDFSQNNTVQVAGILLNDTTKTLEVGENYTLIASVIPKNASNKNVIWQTSNSEIATVDTQGKIKAIAIGTANISATTVDGGFMANCKVTVKNTTFYKKLINSKISIYPNPSNGMFSVTVDVNSKFSLFSTQGKLIKKGILKQGNNQFFINKTGVFILQISNSNQSLSKKIIIK